MEVSLQEVIDHKKLSFQELEKEWKKIETYHKKFKNINKNSFVGNKIIYHFMLQHLLNVKKPNGKLSKLQEYRLKELESYGRTEVYRG